MKTVTDIRNEDILGIRMEIPEGHHHLRARVILRDEKELVFRESAIAAIVRAYVSIKTHPRKTSVSLAGARVEDRKPGYAEWQLVEE